MIKAEIKGDIYDLSYVADAINTAQEDVELTINSPGGSAIEGMNVARAILANANIKVTAKVETMAASAAAVIALSCDKVQMSRMDVLVLHHCWGVNIGNKEELQQELEAMEHIDAILEEYLTKHCKDEEKAELLKQRMAEGDVWLNADESADLFDNVEVVEIPEKDVLQNRVDMGKMVAAFKSAMEDARELRNQAKDLKSQIEDLSAQLTELKMDAENIEEKQNKYASDILAIINEVL